MGEKCLVIRDHDGKQKNFTVPSANFSRFVRHI
jgi:hypothetical protein